MPILELFLETKISSSLSIPFLTVQPFWTNCTLVLLLLPDSCTTTSPKSDPLLGSRCRPVLPVTRPSTTKLCQRRPWQSTLRLRRNLFHPPSSPFQSLLRSKASLACLRKCTRASLYQIWKLKSLDLDPGQTILFDPRLAFAIITTSPANSILEINSFATTASTVPWIDY